MHPFHDLFSIAVRFRKNKIALTGRFNPPHMEEALERIVVIVALRSLIYERVPFGN